MNRRKLLCALAIAAVMNAAPATAQIPSKPITLIVPFAAGGNLDLVARIIAPPMAKLLGQPVVVQNKAGAGGAIGASEVSRAEPDGSTLLVSTPNAIVVLPKMAPTTYDINSFASVGLISSTSQVLVIKTDNPKFNTMAQFLAYTKANPGKVSIAHSGIGTTNHVAIMQLQSVAGLDMNIVAYKGSGPAIVDLLGGQVDVLLDQLSSSINNIKAGRASALTVLSNERDPLLPQAPGTKEIGLAALDVSTTTGLLAPAKTPPATLAALHDALEKILNDEQVKEQLLKVGSTARPGPASIFTNMLIKEEGQAKALAAAGKLKVD
jgi:tripartite-type tricarboxylate transporter receptor subunit TctC